MGVWWLCSCEPLGPMFWVRCAPSFPPSGTTASSDGTKEDWYVTAILVRFGNFGFMLATLLIVDNPISTWDFSATWCRRVQNSAANRQGYRVTKPFLIWRFVNPVYVQEKRCGFSRDPKIPTGRGLSWDKHGGQVPPHIGDSTRVVFPTNCHLPKKFRSLQETFEAPTCVRKFFTQLATEENP